MRKTLVRLTPEAVEFVAHELARKTMEWNESIPEFATRYPQVLESCLEVPFQTYEKKALYPDLIAKAAILFYLMIKNHPFQNGNKRVAVTSLLVFLSLNGRWLKLTARELYRFAVWVAESKAEHKDLVIEAIRGYFRTHMTATPSGITKAVRRAPKS